MNNVFDILLNKLQEWLLPTKLRLEVLKAFINAAFSPIVDLHNSFLEYRSAKFYQIAMNYETCYVEAFLNDRYDYSQRRIHIDDAITVAPIYLYQDSEAKPVYLYQDAENQPAYIYQDGEVLGDVQYDFVIFIPALIKIDENEVRAMVSTKLCGKKYKIERF